MMRCDVGKMKSITINCVTYRSVRAAAQALGVSEERLQRQYDPTYNERRYVCTQKHRNSHREAYNAYHRAYYAKRRQSDEINDEQGGG